MCTDNCNQGRACDCVPDIDLPPEKYSYGWAAVLVMLMSAVLVVAPCTYIWWVTR